jgi:hypothetical protein
VITEEVLSELERAHPQGLSSAEILGFFEENDLKFSEATLRKYVQLGLLPRSVRVGQKGKHQGSKGLYPSGIVRQILAIKEMMAADLTIEEIQQQVLFVRGDIEELERKLDKVFSALRQAGQKQRSEPVKKAVLTELGRAEQLARDLVERIAGIERRLSSQATAARKASGE